MNCSKCGLPLEADQKFCPNCGHRVVKFNDPHLRMKIIALVVTAIVCCVYILFMTVVPHKPLADAEIVEIAVNSLDYVDSYLDGRIGYAMVRNELSDDREKIDALMDESDENDMANLKVSTQLQLVDTAIFLYDREPTNSNFDDIIEYRNELAKCIGEKKR